MLVHVANDVPGAARMHAKLIAHPLGRVVVSSITAHELRFMILRAKASRKHVDRLRAIVRDFPVIEFDLPAAHAAADVRLQLQDIGKPIGIFDMLLAGHARRLGAVVVSDDEDFDRVPGLERENWLR